MSTTVKITKTVTLPDEIKIERYRRVPELGPRILFFSGGTALKRVSKYLIDYTYNSIHIITTFDSGGSSAKIRDAFNMISVGDLRNRLMALADQSVKGNPNIYRLFSYRFPEDETLRTLHKRLHQMAAGNDPLISTIIDPMREIICNHLQYFIERMPIDFDLQGANIGNLILAGGYINNNYNIDTVLYIFSKLVEVRGVVKPVMDTFLHLVAELENGDVLIGQHLITGKEVPKIKSPIKRVYLTQNVDDPTPVSVSINDDINSLISKAELICYPIGSFYSSVIANLIPQGVGKSVAHNNCPKVYVPNTLPDPEQKGMDLYKSVQTILMYLNKDHVIPPENLLDYVIVDTRNAQYPYDLDLDKIENLGLDIIDTELITSQSYPYIDPKCLINVLLSLT